MFKLFSVSFRNVGDAKVEKVRIAAAAVSARLARSATELPVSIEPAQHVAPLQERPAVRFQPGSLRSVAFGPVGALQVGGSRFVQPGHRLPVIQVVFVTCWEHYLINTHCLCYCPAK